ncbi:MAG: glycine--tRNA ligase subunit beta, partial [Coriobacteriia bacterium]|nr:glycine--tRNA ligase subunit beta [Coriobacteriia bacterium]
MSRDLLFEIGVEEIPSAPLYEAVTGIRVAAEKALDDARLAYELLESFGAPRRIVLRVTGLAERQEDRTLRFKGPALKAAFDPAGAPTKAAEGFARGKGLSVADLVTDTEPDGGEYVYAVVEQTGNDASEVLPELLTGLAAGLNWPKSQRWGSGESRFIRPVRWLVALLGDQVIDVEFAGLRAGRHTFGHRFLADPARVPVASASEYDAAARHGMFIYDHAERARIVREGIEALAMSDGDRVVEPE